MIIADLHSHTRYSHGASTPQEMYAAACTAGLKLLGFTEHSRVRWASTIPTNTANS